MIFVGSFCREDYIFEKDMYDVDLPPYLPHDIDLVLNGIREKDDLHMDLYLDELYESINSAYWDGVISEKHANHLREKYLAGAF